MKVVGTVMKGQGLAAAVFGVPTANIALTQKLSVEPGTYAGYARVGKNRHASLLYLAPGELQKLEVHIFDFAEDLYGKELEVEILDKLSEPVVWESEAQMKEKIAADTERARDYFATQSSSA